MFQSNKMLSKHYCRLGLRIFGQRNNFFLAYLLRIVDRTLQLFLMFFILVFPTSRKYFIFLYFSFKWEKTFLFFPTSDTFDVGEGELQGSPSGGRVECTWRVCTQEDYGTLYKIQYPIGSMKINPSYPALASPASIPGSTLKKPRFNHLTHLKIVLSIEYNYHSTR